MPTDEGIVAVLPARFVRNSKERAIDRGAIVVGQIDEPALVPEEFDLNVYLGNAWCVHRGDRAFDVEILFDRAAAAIVTETVWHHTQAVHRHEGGDVTLRFRVDGLNEIVRWLLGWSGWATVVRPEELRHLVVVELAKALAMNRLDRCSSPPGR